MKRFIASLLLALTLAVAFSATASAQTGPIGGGGKSATPVTAARLNKDQVLNKMREVGFEIINSHEYPNGAFVGTGRIARDGWNFEIDINMSNEGSRFWMRASLTTVPSGAPVSGEALLRLLAENKKRDAFFQFEVSTRKVELAQLFMAGDLARLGDHVANFCSVIRTTQPLWSADALTGGVSVTAK